MDPGKLRERVRIERPLVPTDGYGMGTEPEYEDIGSVWAAVRPLRAQEVLRAQQAGQETAFVVNIRYRADVTSDCRLVWRDKVLDIEAVIDVGARRAWLELMCHARQVT